MKQSVPLVVYKDEERIVIGEADLVPGAGTDIVVHARIDPSRLGVLLASAEPMSIGHQPGSISAFHAAEYGVPKATPESIGAWARMVESQSCLGKEGS